MATAADSVCVTIVRPTPAPAEQAVGHGSEQESQETASETPLVAALADAQHSWLVGTTTRAPATANVQALNPSTGVSSPAIITETNEVAPLPVLAPGAPDIPLVVLLQEALNAKLPAAERVSENGVFDEQTCAALRRFLTRAGVPVREALRVDAPLWRILLDNGVCTVCQHAASADRPMPAGAKVALGFNKAS